LAKLLSVVFDGTQELREVYQEVEEGKVEKVAIGYEYEEELSVEDESGEPFTWIERRIVVCSLKYAEKQKESLFHRVERAREEIEFLNQEKQGKRRYRSCEELESAVLKILKKYRVSGLFNLNYNSEVEIKELRRYGNRPSGIREERRVWVEAQINTEELEKQSKRLGWRVLVSNQGKNELSLEKAVKAYRSQYLIER
jgi:transposase